VFNSLKDISIDPSIVPPSDDKGAAMLMQHFKSDTSMIHHEVSSPMFVREHETAMLRARVNKLESELAKCKAEND
jgi:hypothetical protein